MANYKIQLTNGQELVLLNDGIVNTEYPVTLIGKNVSNFGDAQNENFVHLLENFSHSLQPANPLKGQIWFKSNENFSRPVIFDGENWRPIATSLYWSSTTDVFNNFGGFSIAASRPGDFWFDSVKQQLHVVTSGTTTATQTVLIGPERVPDFDVTKLVSSKVFDNRNIPYPVIQVVLDGETIAIMSKSKFTQGSSTLVGFVPGFPVINRGITFKNYNSSTRYTTATTDVALYGLHEQLDPSYLRRNVNEHIQSDWYIDTNYELKFGTNAESNIAWNSGLLIESTSSVVLKSQGTMLSFNGTSIIPSANVNLGATTSRFGNLFVELIDSVNLTSTKLTATLVSVESASISSISNNQLLGQDAQFSNVVTSNLSATTINSTSGTFENIISTSATIDSISATTVTVPSGVITNLTVNNTVTTTGTITAVTYNGINYYGGNFYGNELYDNGSRVVTSATVKTFDLNAIKLRGEDGVNYYTASQRNVGNTIVQRHPTGAVTATSIEVDSLIATGGSPSSIGTITGQWSLGLGSRLQATYADLAECYRADAEYLPGTVLEFGGSEEVTIAADSSRKVAGVVTTNPAYLMNKDLTGTNVVAIALIGRVPCKVKGPVRKGDLMIAADDGFARTSKSPMLGCAIGKSLEDFNDAEGVIEVVVGRL